MIGRRPNPRGLSSKGEPCFLRNASHSNRRTGAHTGANQTVPYRTAILRSRCPGTSCQATIGLSLRDWRESPVGATNRLKHSLTSCHSIPGLSPITPSGRGSREPRSTPNKLSALGRAGGLGRTESSKGFDRSGAGGSWSGRMGHRWWHEKGAINVNQACRRTGDQRGIPIIST
jgi:hypothetical protein